MYITAIEKFAAVLSSLGHACAPPPQAMHSAAQYESEGLGIQALASYLRETQWLYTQNYRVDLPLPVTPTAHVPAKLVHVTCTSRTRVEWTPSRFRIVNVDRTWDYDSDTVLGYLEEDKPYNGVDVMIRTLIYWEASPGSSLGRSLAGDYPELYWQAIQKYAKESPEWSRRLGFSGL